MLAAAENALVAAIKVNRVVAALKLRTVESLPKLPTENLLARYANDAPAIYVIPGTLRGVGDDFALTFKVAGVVRNVAGAAQARKGDGIDIGCDHLLIATTRAVHGHFIGGCNWDLVAAEMVDDDLFDKAGLAAVEMTFQSSRLEMPVDWEIGELDKFKHFHADLDIEPQAGAAEHQKWLQTPPDYTTSRPDAGIDAPLEGAP